VCTSCGAPFVPKGGDSRCGKCAHVRGGASVPAPAKPAHAPPPRLCKVCGYDLRGVSPAAACTECGTPQPAAPTARSRQSPRDELVDYGAGRAARVAAAIVVAMLLHGAAIFLVARHWWAFVLGDWAAVVAWGALALAAGVIAMPTVLPRSVGARRWPIGAAVGGATLAALSLAGYPLLGGAGSIPAHAALDLLTVIGAVAFLIGMSQRIRDIASWEGHGAEDLSLLSSAGPPILAIFVGSTMFMLTPFFLRRIDFADVFVMAFALWMLLRLAAVAWHAYEAGTTSVNQQQRRERFRS